MKNVINAPELQLEQLGEYLEESNFDAFFKNVDNLLSEFKQQQQMENYITCLIYKSTAYYKVQNLFLATQILSEEAELIEQFATTKQKVRYYNLLASIHSVSLNNNEAYDYLYIAKRLAEKINYHEKLVHIYNNLATHYYKYGDYEKSLLYAKKSLSYYQITANHDYITLAINYIHILLKLKQLDKAIHLLNKIKSLAEFTPEHPKYIAYIKINVLVLLEKNNVRDALHLIEQSLSKIQSNIRGQYELTVLFCEISKRHHPSNVYLQHLKKLFSLKKQLSSNQKKQQLETVKYYFDHQSLKEDSWTDPLTKIYNRRYLEENYPVYNEPFASFIFDLDNFKQINDRYGHQTGDIVLQLVAERVNNYITSLNGHFVRLGGDEFFGLFPVKSEQLLFEKIDHLMILFETLPIEINHNTIPITISLGVLYCDASINFEDTLKEVDRALYKAKENGRNQYTIIN